MNRAAHWKIAVVTGLSLCAACKPDTPAPDPKPSATAKGDWIRENNRGVGLMGQFKYEPAAKVFAELVNQVPDNPDVRVNLAISTLNQQSAEKVGEARALLVAVLKKHPEHVGANYCLGLLKLYEGGTGDPVPHFRRVVEADPDDADAAFLLGSVLEQQDQMAEADSWFAKSLELNPNYASALLARSRIARRIRTMEEAKDWLDQFQQMKDNPHARVFAFKYMSMGQYAEAKAAGGEAPPPDPPKGSLFLDAEPVALGESAAPLKPGASASITVCDIDEDGDLDLFVLLARVKSSDGNAILLQEEDGAFLEAAGHPLAAAHHVKAVLWGDVDNDGHPDVFFAQHGGDQLWKRSEQGWARWDVPLASADASSSTIGGALFDADHDGDLDIYCVNRRGPNRLLNNNRDGTFKENADAQEVAGTQRESQHVVMADFDNDRDTDLVVLNESPPHDLYLNDRLWKYRHVADFGPLAQHPTDASVAVDWDVDGRTDIVTLSGSHVAVWRQDGLVFDQHLAVDVPGANADGVRPRLMVADVSGNGVNELLVAGRDGVTVVNHKGKVSERIALPEGKQLKCWNLASLQPDKGPSVVMLAEDGTLLQAAPGKGRHAFASVAFSGQESVAKSTRSNASGIGTRWTARIGSQRSNGAAFPSSSGPGQSLQPVGIGLGGHDQIDVLEMIWSDGVFQSELALGPGFHEITETQRQLSSCPVLFAWDGEQFAFVTDLLGVGGMGFLVQPGVYNTPRPHERLLLDSKRVQPRDGRFLLKVGEPMEEACYLDGVSLQAHDLPPGWSLTLDERTGLSEPMPTGQDRHYQQALAPIAVVNERGEDQLNAVLVADGSAADVGETDPRFLGLLDHVHVLELDFGAPLDSLTGDAMLVMDGWIEYPYAQTMFAAWQAGCQYDAPSIDAWDGGAWVTVHERIGYPAGMPRQMSVPLGDLPAGTRRLRIRSNMEIYWDRIRVAFDEPCHSAVKHDLRLVTANLKRVGFARRTTLAQRRPEYAYSHRERTWDARHQLGAYTRFGDVMELVETTDDAVAIFGPGEEVHLEFVDRLPALQDGWSRFYVLSANGWCKDMDLFTRNGDTLAPLPVRDAANCDHDTRSALHGKYNVRLEAGR